MKIHLIIILYKFSRAMSDLHFRHNIGCFCSILPMKIVPTKDHSTVLHLWEIDSVYLLNESAFWMNRLNKWFSDSLINFFNINTLSLNESAVWMNLLNLTDSLINSHLLHLLAVFISHFGNFFSMSKYFKYQYSTFCIFKNKILGLFVHL